jgi:BirA family biotin operon repressor/biotin-[acetyl-CoA-carboxylase] ligase
MVSILRLEEVDSTNTYVAKNVAELESATIVTTDNQTAGRGQRGNSWESEPGMNLTFTMLMRPEKFAAIRQFSLSEAVAVAIVDVIGEELEIFTEIKWPNDIYWRDNKLAGILIEHAVMGSEIMHTIIGVGLNVNQTKFLSDAPNPISLRQILINRGEKGDTIIDRDILLEKIGTRIKENILRLTDKKELERMNVFSSYINLEL